MKRNNIFYLKYSLSWEQIAKKRIEVLGNATIIYFNKTVALLNRFLTTKCFFVTFDLF